MTLRQRMMSKWPALVWAKAARSVARFWCSNETHCLKCCRSTQYRPSRVKQRRSEEHTSELQSLMRISYAVFCLKKKKTLVREVTNKRKHITQNTDK